MKTRTTCRVCNGALSPILTLGEHYVSNFLEPGQEDGIKAPLDLALCNKCKLLQLKHTVPAEAMYRNYWYRSGTNTTMPLALRDIANKAEVLMHLEAGDAILDIGCNDGTLLASYRTGGLYRIGFDPAENLAPFSRRVADKVMSTFFDAETYNSVSELQGRRPRVVTSIAMFYDLEDPKRFVSDVKAIMHPDGLWIIQMSYLPFMLKQNAFDNICHEHLEYYSLQSLRYLLDLYDLQVVDVEFNDVNGGSLRAYIRNRPAERSSFGDSTYRTMATERVTRAVEEEIRIWSLEEDTTYTEFATRVERIKNDVVGFITEQVHQDKRVYVYGASTKGNTLLQYFGLDNSRIAGAAERNPDKWGKVTVGTHIPIVSEQEARSARPDYFLVLPWHFVEEFMEREKEYLHSTGRFILPLPHFTLI